MRKILFLLFFATLTVACSKDTPDDQGGSDLSLLHFMGNVSVTPLPESHFNAFEDPNIGFDLRTEKNGTATLIMNKIKFVEQMPKRVTFEVRNLSLGTTADGQQHFEATTTVPYWNGVPYDPTGDGTYTIHRLLGTISKDKTKLSLSFDCYTMHVSYIGNH
ncbi:MAG: hypothetical protein RR330_03555 [Alistipes sp.]